MDSQKIASQIILPNGETIQLSGSGGEIDLNPELTEYMKVVKPNIKQAIINKGGEVLETDSFNQYATRINEIPNDVSPAQTLPHQTILIAESSSSGVALKWQDVGADGYLIVRKENVKPTCSADGTLIYSGVYKTDLIDEEVSYGNTYYYRIFPRNSVNQYQGIEDGSIAVVNHIDRSGQVLIKDLELGDVIKFGQHGSSLLTWTIVDTLDKDSGYVTVACNQHAGSIQFDSPENGSTPNPNTDRKNNGNNRWAYSNVRQFINSDGEAGEWYVAQHEYDVQPNYANQAGFLNAFTDYEKNIIVSKTNKCNLPNVDGGGSETVVDKMWFASSYAMGLEVFQPLEDEHVYEYFTDNESRSFTSNYWLRTINGVNSSNQVRLVNSGGTLSHSSASSSNAGRPFCQLPTSAYVEWKDEDSAYVFVDDSQRNGG